MKSVENSAERRVSRANANTVQAQAISPFNKTIVDNRPQALVQRKLQEKINGSPRQTAHFLNSPVLQRYLNKSQLDDALIDLKINFNAGFTVADALAFNSTHFTLLHSTSDIMYAIRRWRQDGVLYPAIPLTEKKIPKGITLSFNQADSQYPTLKKDKKTRREAAGYRNPSHNHPYMRPLFRNAALSPRDTSRTEEDWLFSPSRRFNTYSPTHTRPPLIVQGHSNTVMGHHPDASSHWNAIGHTQTRRQNQQHNNQVTTYHGLEEARASAASGRLAAPYLSPNAAQGSHSSHWDSNHADFDSDVPWTTY